MTLVCCIYGAGGEFTVDHVLRWVDQVRQHTPPRTLIGCLTDSSEVLGLVDRVYWLTSEEMSWGWAGCWPKLALFNHRRAPTLYLDLDVNAVGDLSPMLALCEQHDLIASRDFWGCSPPSINASVVGWRGDLSHVSRAFAADPEAGKLKPEGWPHRLWDDQGWLLTRAQRPIPTWQELLPGSVLSYKRDVLRGADPGDMRVCVSHGLPRPWAADGADAWLAKRGKLS